MKMTKEELSRAYTHKKVEEKIVSDNSEFMPSDIIKAYEDGYDKAVGLACEFLKEHREEVRTEDNGIMGWIEDCFIENFKNYMEGK